MCDFRIGHGYDAHRLVAGRALILGGVQIEHTHGLLGHSDADVLTHAVIDAILGALGLGDIGRHFPDTNEELRGTSSLLLLKRAAELIGERGYAVGNIDATIIAERPKLASHITDMKYKISHVLGVESDRVNIKATTEEGLGFSGREEGIAAHAVALVYKK